MACVTSCVVSEGRLVIPEWPQQVQQLWCLLVAPLLPTFAFRSSLPIISMTLTEAEIRAINLIEVRLGFPHLDLRLPGFSCPAAPLARRCCARKPRKRAVKCRSPQPKPAPGAQRREEPPRPAAMCRPPHSAILIVMRLYYCPIHRSDEQIRAFYKSGGTLLPPATSNGAAAAAAAAPGAAALAGLAARFPPPDADTFSKWFPGLALSRTASDTPR